MINIDKFYIGGEWVVPAGTDTMPILTPRDNSRVGTLTLGNAADVDRAVAAASRAFETFSMTSKAERLDLLRRMARITAARMDDLAHAITTEMGAPITMSRDVQADSGLGHLNAFIAALEALEEEETLPNGDRLTREPIGVCGLITPWNWPINQIALKVVPALATGSTCVLKPSEHTPLSAQIYAEIIHEAGYPAGVFNLVHGDGPTVGAAMSRHPDVAMMSFTGSTRAGSAVSRDAADTIKRVTLELGGKSPNLVFADCDLETRIREGVQTCFYNTGQSCDAPTRMLVERGVYDRAVQIARDAARAQQVGDPLAPGDHIGPLFDGLQYDRVQAMIAKGIDEGATLLVGGPGRPDALAPELQGGWFVRPTIFADVTPDMAIWRQEIFGPVLVMTPFDTEDEAIAMANDTEYGLAAYLQTGNEDRARRVARRLRAGGIHINGRDADYGSPFGGFKHSGIGREGGRFGLEDYLELKSQPPFAL
ncbi:aldehyde dehydrogenase family protein [Paracoccus sp. 1_MG-2023]|uniref:aldehyde dehydrogenase family protein n=1 Tax=unclassified Paracoccus (in: a-proteobacteria) TaxID=2688777 RepID=UPI001C094B99|nr:MULTISPECIES: aldehyde dehydrogenase family protein [unclassified Paracoccus (in: a-proteobacteria)]MBU2957827.1 aldehyde dehydrogenase family protein [Paracoccus sp. C2R09]MDO6667325.1 aldehyde dehydrogenase family protein [Paracoccus sp. 1_MG-2023]